MTDRTEWVARRRRRALARAIANALPARRRTHDWATHSLEAYRDMVITPATRVEVGWSASGQTKWSHIVLLRAQACGITVVEWHCGYATNQSLLEFSDVAADVPHPLCGRCALNAGFAAMTQATLEEILQTQTKVE